MAPGRMAPPRRGAPGENVATRTGAGQCRGLPPGGRPPCAAGAKAEWPHHGGSSLWAYRARPPDDLARHQAPCQVAVSRGARRAPLKPWGRLSQATKTPERPKASVCVESCLSGRPGSARPGKTVRESTHQAAWAAPGPRNWTAPMTACAVAASPAVQQWSTATPLYPGGSWRTLADPFTWPDLA